jgi:putative endonuclease
MFYVYIVECVDKTLYCGYTNNLEARIKEHNNGNNGAKYTKTRRPVHLVFSENFESKSSAMKREYEIKQLSKLQKINLINLQ